MQMLVMAAPSVYKLWCLEMLNGEFAQDGNGHFIITTEREVREMYMFIIVRERNHPSACAAIIQLYRTAVSKRERERKVHPLPYSLTP